MKAILENIKKSIDRIDWKSETKKEKAIDLCICIYNLYVYNGGDFNHYLSLSKEYFIKIIKKQYMYEIKNKLIENKILEEHPSGSYNVLKGKGKGYRFNQELIKGNYVSSSKSLFHNLYNLELYHICGLQVQERIQSSFERLTFKPEVNDFINTYTLKREDIKINNEIDLDYVKLKLENDEWRVSLDKAIELSNGVDLILYKEKCYIEPVEDFIIRKTNELRLIFRKNIFEVENNIFRINRNDTNMRLDYNLTNMKSELLDYLEIDGETLIELDIANAQFAFLAYLTKDLDSDFINKSQIGNLYDGDKKEWFRIAFDKIKKEHDKHRELYPKTMKFIDEYKKEFGYKSFSNLLQKTESSIMIDGLLPRLIKNFEVFPIHDAIRVKQSELELIKKEAELYFNEIGFKCLLRIKNAH